MRVERSLLLITAPLTLLVGIAMADAAALQSDVLWPPLLAPLATMAMGPFLLALLLRFLAPGFDLVLVAAACVLAFVGTTALLLLAVTPGPDQPFYEVTIRRHAFFVIAGFVALMVGAVATRWVDLLRGYPFTLLGLALLLTLATVTIGETANGARLWLRVGPVRFQPSEIARLLVVAFVAVYLYERRHLVAAPWRVRSVELPPVPYLAPLAAAVLLATGVLVLQNDLGMAALVVLGALASFVGVQQSRPSVVVASLVLGLASVGMYLGVPRVQDRVAGWLDPWRDPAVRGFQFVQADFGLASGGIAGTRGLAPAGVPEVHTDLILVAVGSQLGWLGATAVLGLVAIIVSRCVLNAIAARDGLRGLLALSLAALIGIQVLLIAGGTLRVLPLTGLTFPLVSYGGTSMIVTFFAVGVVAGIGSRP
jgi:cell division protein FtsW (lipid II flippase)